MPLPPILAQTISLIPPELVQLGTVGIIAAALLGVVYVIRPLIAGFVGSYKELASVNRELLRRLEASDAAMDRSTAQAAKTEVVLSNVENVLTKQADALVALVKAQPDMIAQIVKSTETQADRAIRTISDNLNTREAAVEASLARIEAQLAAITERYEHGTRVKHAEVIDLLNVIRAEIAGLKPPPPPPVVLKHPEPLEPRKEAAA